MLPEHCWRGHGGPAYTCRIVPANRNESGRIGQGRAEHGEVGKASEGGGTQDEVAHSVCIHAQGWGPCASWIEKRCIHLSYDRFHIIRFSPNIQSHLNVDAINAVLT